MRIGRGIAATIVVGIWFAAVSAAAGQDVAPAGPDAEQVARVLEAATNLPQVLAQSSQFATEAERDAALEAERLRLVEILRNDGYLRAEIALQWPLQDAGKVEKLQVRVDPGPRYLIGAVTFATTTMVADTITSVLQSTAEAAVGSPANAATRSTLSSRLTWVLGANGYPFARVELLDVTPAGHTADLAIRIAPGVLSRFVSVDLASVDPALHDAVSALVPFTPGDLYSVDALAAFRQNLAGLAGVDTTRVDVVADGSAGFGLAVRAKRTYTPLPNTLESGLAFGLLIASLAMLALRQAAVAGRLGRMPVKVLTAVTGGVLVISAGLIAVRALALI